MYCRECRGKTIVIDTRSFEDEVYRKRKCLGCGRKFYTAETEDDGFEDGKKGDVFILQRMEVSTLTKKEFALLASAIKTFYPREQLLPNTQAMELWFQMLGDIPYNVAEAALQKWVATNKFSPTIADLRELSTSIQHGDLPVWGDAWETVRDAVQKYGWYRQEEAMASLDDLTRECVRRIGFERLCHSEEPALERANFRMVYETMAQRRKTQEQLPTGLATLIGQIRDSLAIEEAKNE